MSKERETVLVTGAAGTVGAYVVEELVRGGHRVIACDRPGSRWALTNADAVEVREGDLTDLSFAVDAVRGARSVIHTAATIDLAQPYEVQAKINVDAVRYLYEAGRAAGIRRFVHFSSGSIYRKGREPISESTPFNPTSTYEQTKVEAERYLWARPRSGPEVTIVRPTMIYGPRARFLGARLAIVPPIAALLFSKHPSIRGLPKCNWVHAEDVARAAVFLLFEPRAAWEAYNVAEDVTPEMGELLDVIVRAYGFETGRTIRYPRRIMNFLAPFLADRDVVLRAATIAAQRTWRYLSERHGLVASGIAIGIDKEMFDYATTDVVFDNSKLKALGFALRKSIDKDYVDVLRWFQAHRWVPSYDRRGSDGWGASAGFSFDEVMAGTWRRPGESPRPFRFSIRARAANARQFARDGLLEIEGSVEATGLSERHPLHGTLDISWRKKRELCYEFDFDGDGGEKLHFTGRKDVRLLHFVDTMTTLPGRILDAEGREIGTAMAYFDLRHDLVPMVSSFQAAGAPAAATAAPA